MLYSVKKRQWLKNKHPRFNRCLLIVTGSHGTMFNGVEMGNRFAVMLVS